MAIVRKLLVAPALLALLLSCCAAPARAAAPPALIGHVWVIVLENESATTTFGPTSPAPYLAQTLSAAGAFVPGYYGIGHNSNPNYIAMISGQAPNLQNQMDCPKFDDLTPGSIGAFGQASGSGCVFPADVPTIASQLDAARLSWRDYNEGMGADPQREAAACGHPVIGQMDTTEVATPSDQYATRHNPFVYFHSVIDDAALCNSHVVTLDPLLSDLATPTTAPTFSFITPNLCNDGHDAKCANGGPGGLPAADTFLRTWVPRITGSAAFQRQNGLLAIIFDESTGLDTSSCCGEVPGPGQPLPGITGPGGGRTGAVLLSPCIAPGTMSAVAYNHYGLLRSVEDLFGLAHLGYAAGAGVQSFGADIFTRRCDGTPTLRLTTTRLGRPGRTVAVVLHWRTTSLAYASSNEVQELAPGARGWKTLARATTASSLRVSVRRGRRYSFRVRGAGVAGAGRWTTTRLRA